MKYDNGDVSCDFSDIDRDKVKTVTLDLTLDEFEILVGCFANMSYDITAGPSVLMNKGNPHPFLDRKMMAILRITSKADTANALARKLEETTEKLSNTDNI